MKIDSLTWQGIVDDTLLIYDDSLHIIRGDVSDSSLVVNYCVLTPEQYDTMRRQRDAGNANTREQPRWHTTYSANHAVLQRLASASVCKCRGILQGTNI